MTETPTTERQPIGDILDLGRRYLSGDMRQHRVSSNIELSRRGDIPDFRSASEAEQTEWFEAGLHELQSGSVVFGILAAGASSRMDLKRLPDQVQTLLERAGSMDLPQSKALVPVVEQDGEVHTFLDLFLHNVRRLAAEADIAPQTLLFVSEKNKEELLSHVAARFAEEPHVVTGVRHFMQPLEPQIIARVEDVERARGNFASEADFRSALEVSQGHAGHALHVPKPAGHGEFLHQLIESGTAARLHAAGVRYLSVRNIDNVPAVLDRSWITLLGYLVAHQRRLLVEVSERLPSQKGGALIRWRDSWRLAEDPSFTGSGLSAGDSFYINNAVAILKLDYLLPLYDTTFEELEAAEQSGDPQQLAAIAARGRRRFPTIIEAKPVALPDGRVVGAITPETNMWESTTVADDLRIGAFGVYSEADAGHNIRHATAAEQVRRAQQVRFAPVKKWSDYVDEDKQTIIARVAERILRDPLL